MIIKIGILLLYISPSLAINNIHQNKTYDKNTLTHSFNMHSNNKSWKFFVLSRNDPKFYTSIRFRVYREESLSGFAFIRKTDCSVSQIVKTVYQVLRLSCIISNRACILSYRAFILSNPIVRASYPIVCHVKVNVADTVPPPPPPPPNT